jgi:hypothetical protein
MPSNIAITQTYNTVINSTPQIIIEIQNLQECCWTTLHRVAKLLESELQLHAKILAFKLGVICSESNILARANSDGLADDSSRVAVYELESTEEDLYIFLERFLYVKSDL